MNINIGKIVTGILAFFMAIIEFILVFRFVLKLFAASSTADFTLVIYDASEPLVSMFVGVFPDLNVAGFTLELSTLLSIVVYGIIGGIFYLLARNLGGVSVKTKHDNQPLVSVSQPQPSTPQYQPPVQQIPQQPVQPVQTQPFTPVQSVQPIASSNFPTQTSSLQSSGYNPPTVKPLDPAPQSSPAFTSNPDQSATSPNNQLNTDQTNSPVNPTSPLQS